MKGWQRINLIFQADFSGPSAEALTPLQEVLV